MLQVYLSLDTKHQISSGLVFTLVKITRELPNHKDVYSSDEVNITNILNSIKSLIFYRDLNHRLQTEIFLDRDSQSNF